MNAPLVTCTVQTSSKSLFSPPTVAAQLRLGSPALAWWGALLLVTMLPLLAGLTFDERTLRGASVWSKPLKFHASLALLAWTTAWFMALIEPARRRSPLLRSLVIAQIAAAAFEVVYIDWQAAHGEASHFYVSDTFHAAMYQLMGLGSLTLVATQGLLAREVHRHALPSLAPAWKLSIVLGLALSFVLGTLAGGFLSARQPVIGGVPITGWSLAGGDLRPAHFLGLHAAQLLPLFGAFVARDNLRAVAIAATVYTLLFALAFGRGF